MKEVVIVSAVRTPIGSYGGSLKTVSARELGAQTLKEALKRANLKPEQVEEVYLGTVLQGGQGQNVARQVSLDAGLPVEVPAMTVNIICGSGLRTVSMGYQSIISGNSDIVVAGGTENMSLANYSVSSNRWGQRMGNSQMVDMMVNDGLTDAFGNGHMGITAENISERYGLTREELDAFAVNSQEKASKAQKEGKFKDEIVPVEVTSRKGTTIFEEDEYIKHDASVEGLAKLRPAFKKDGVVTAGNASGINDGSAVIILMSKEKADELGIEPLATIVSHATKGVDPSVMGLGPVPASQEALKRAGLTIEDIDLVESNEAFAAQSLAVARDLNLDLEKTNVNGGAIALGHPIGASGARILVTLLHEMKRRESTYGLATLCIGGGMGTSLIVKM